MITPISYTSARVGFAVFCGFVHYYWRLFFSSLWKKSEQQWLSRLQLDQSSKDRWLHQVVWSALRVMVIASLKRRAFKLPLPGYTHGARAMERCYNGLHMKWHPVTTFVCGEEDPGSNDSPAVRFTFTKGTIESGWHRAKQTFLIWKSHSLSLCKMWDPYARISAWVSYSVLWMGGFPWAASPGEMLAQPCSSPAHITGKPPRSASPATFFQNVRVHVGAIWRITWWQPASSLAAPKGQLP